MWGAEAIIQRLLLAALLCHQVCFCSEDVSIQSEAKGVKEDIRIKNLNS